MVRANRARRVHIPGAAYAGDNRAERLGDLHRERAPPSRRTVYQDFVPGLNSCLVAKTLQCSQGGYRCGRGLLICQVIRFDDQRGLQAARRLGNRILGKRPGTRAEHLVARFELCYVLAHRFNLAGHIHAGAFHLRLAEPE